MRCHTCPKQEEGAVNQIWGGKLENFARRKAEKRVKGDEADVGSLVPRIDTETNNPRYRIPNTC